MIPKKRYTQMTFSDPKPANIDRWILNQFSANDECSQSERKKIEEKYKEITIVSNDFSRQSVSYQLSKTDNVQRWLKYKEGFSADLVNTLLDIMKIEPGDFVLDPFLGSGTTSMVCSMRGVNSIGFDILPTSKVSIEAKSSIMQYDVDELKQIKTWIETYVVPDSFNKRTPYIPITEGAYPTNIELELEYVSDTMDSSGYSVISKNLVKLCLVNALEQISYTSKDGQYLRWDFRSSKVIKNNEKRQLQGKPLMEIRLDKGKLPSVREVLLSEFNHVISDIVYAQSHMSKSNATVTFILGSILFNSFKVESNSISGVITSPPYCNRYDYTRTYALELAFLGVDKDQINSLRQELLTCTVENKSKMNRLEQYYESNGHLDDFNIIVNLIKSNDVLNEIVYALKHRLDKGEINNKGIISMVEGYFTELTFVYYELFRMCKPGAHVAFINDNVRYAGEVIPVDFLSTYIAETIGFEPVRIYTLPQQKGNSSQQMKKYGRVALRKSITLWKKP